MPQTFHKAPKPNEYQQLRLNLLSNPAVKLAVMGGFYAGKPAVHLIAILEEEAKEGQTAQIIVLPIARMYDADEMQFIGDPENNTTEDLLKEDKRQ